MVLFFVFGDWYKVFTRVIKAFLKFKLRSEGSVGLSLAEEKNILDRGKYMCLRT